MTLKQVIDNKLKELYHNSIPQEVKSRVKAELSIITKEKQYQYLIAYKISEKAKSDGRIMIDRVCGSSYIAYLLGITFVNPLTYYIPYEKEFKPITFDLEFARDYFDDILKYTKKVFKEENVIINNLDDLKKHNFYLNTFDWCDVLEKLFSKTKINRYEIDIHDRKIYECLVDEKRTLLDSRLMNMVKKLNEVDFYIEDIQDLAVVISLGSSTLDEELDLMHCPRYREDIYRYLVNNGIEKELAYEMMNFIAKGKRHYHEEQWNNYVTIMKNCNITDEYVKMCSKIDYLYPKSYSYNRAMLYAWLTYYKIYFP